jgi:hypothetical protein
LPIVPAKGGDPTRCLIHRANASKRAVIDALAALESAGEIEVRTAQRGRRRINVYRVVLGQVAASPVDYSDLPFDLEQPFGYEVQNLHLVKSDVSDDGVQISSPRGADFVNDDTPKTADFAGDSSPQPIPEASSEPKDSPAIAGESAAPAPQTRDGDIWKFLEETFGKVVPRTNAHGKRSKAAADLRRLGATQDTLRHAIVRWSFVMPPGTTMTDVGLATHFPQLVNDLAKQSPLERQTQTAAQREWVIEQASDPSVPLFTVMAEISDWHLDHIESGGLIELAESTRAALDAADHKTEEAAA